MAEWIVEIRDGVPHIRNMTELVRCKECIHRPTDTGVHNYGQDLVFPDNICPCQVGDEWFSWMPDDDWFCKDGERRE